MAEYTVKSNGIYHGLPQFPSHRNLTALVVGTNGISGRYMVDVLSEAPARWTQIYSLSRKPPSTTLPDHVTHVSADLLAPVDTIAAQLREHEVRADYVFFFAYIQPPPKAGGGIWSDADELVRVNTTLLNNFLGALARNNTIPKHIVLQLGAKYYGVHLGPTAIPQIETAPRITLEPNFYYPQEDSLAAFCAAHGANWTTTRPSQIVGAATTVVMNLALALGVYAVVQRRLRRPLRFPVDFAAWETPMDLSSARMNAYLAEWAALNPAADGAGGAGESFNACDGSPFTWRLFWPQLARRFGMDWEGPADAEGTVWRERRTPYDPPPRGYGGPAVRRYGFFLTEWVRTEEVRRAWTEIVQETGVRWDEVMGDVDAVFGFADNTLGMSYLSYLSMGKARKRGFFGYVDSCESLLQTLDEFVELKLLPPLDVEK